MVEILKFVSENNNTINYLFVFEWNSPILLVIRSSFALSTYRTKPQDNFQTED